VRLLELAENLHRQGKYAEAEPFYRQFAASRQARLPAGDEDRIRSTLSFARLLSDWHGLSVPPGVRERSPPQTTARAGEASVSSANAWPRTKSPPDPTGGWPAR